MSGQNNGERKHLFGTTEKSDFILNMSQEQTYKFCGLYSIIAIAVLLAINIPYTFVKHTFDYVNDDGNKMYADSIFADYASILVVGAGLIGLWFFLVGRMKKEVIIGKNRSLSIIVLVIAVSAWSMFASGNISTGFFGYLDRSEGLLTILAYWGFFAAGMAVTGDKWRMKFTDFIVAAGLLNAVVGILQAIPALYDVVPNKFKDLFIRLGEKTLTDNEVFIEGEGIFEKGYASTGFLITPYALAAVMTISFALAASGFVFDKSGKKKVFYGVSAVACTTAAVLTKTVVGMIGIGAAVLAVLVIALVSVSAKKQKKPFALALCTALAVGACVIVLFVSGAAELKDEEVIYTDTIYRLSAGNLTDGKPRGNDTELWIYPYLWNDGAYVIELHPITGVGPDNWNAMLDEAKCTSDRSFNEYIDVAMQRGIICLGLYVIFLIITLKKAICAVGRHFKDGEKVSWAAVGILTALIGYIVQAFFSSGSNYSSPYFFLIAGIAWSYFAAENKAAKQGKAKGKAKTA